MIVNLFQGATVGDKIGGGHSFHRNFILGLQELKHTTNNAKFDISLACAPTLVNRDQWNSVKAKPRVLRIDGIPEDFRNRGTGWSRTKEFSQQADLVIYQSEFIRSTVGKLLGRDGPVICNGTNKQIFNTTGAKKEKFGNPSIVFVHFRHDPNKRFQEAIERFRYYKLEKKNATMTFVGDYPKAQVMWSRKNYDFGMLSLKQNKDWRYLGIAKDRNQLATILRSHDFIAYPSFADPCPNTLIEAMACGLKPLWINDYGSSPEIIGLFKSGYDFSLRHMTERYISEFKKVI